jgi:hypothetical protein
VDGIEEDSLDLDGITDGKAPEASFELDGTDNGIDEGSLDSDGSYSGRLT